MIVYNKSWIESKKNKIVYDGTTFDFCLNQIIIKGNISHIFGLGERFQSIDHINQHYQNEVYEKFCYQGAKTYFPLPFMFFDNGLGIFIDSKNVFEIFTEKDKIIVLFKELLDEDRLYLFSGSPKNIIEEFIKLTGEYLIPPKWSFGPWMSAHRWHTQKMVEDQIQNIEEYKTPFTVMVIEQWSDESTFYVFNGATYKASDNPKTYEDFNFDNSVWYNPKKLVKNLHDKGLKLILWQAPMIKMEEDHEALLEQHQLDKQAVIDLDLCIKNNNGKPYQIPKDKWFKHSYVPDFTNAKMREWWFSRRQYLLDIGIDGFKTDGGEFIYEDRLVSEKLKNKQLKNGFVQSYIDAYHEFIGNQRVLFSRAGYLGFQKSSILWAGDQKSSWDELMNVYRAGISASMSGISFWSFDIGGFSGYIPPVDLYKRSVQFATFSPIMQLHAEPVGGQFSLVDQEVVMNNERTPWNIGKQYKDKNLVYDVQKYFWLRMNILNHIYSQSKILSNKHMTLMRHMYIDFNDFPLESSYNQYMFTNLLIAPILEDGQKISKLYLPKGKWYHLFNHKKYNGNREIELEALIDDINVFIKSGEGIMYNTDESLLIPSYITYETLDQKYILYGFGSKGSYQYIYNEDICEINWENNQYSTKGKCPPFKFKSII